MWGVMRGRNRGLMHGLVIVPLVIACGPSQGPPATGSSSTTGSTTASPASTSSTAGTSSGSSSDGSSTGPGTTGGVDGSTGGTSTGEPLGPVAYCAEVTWGGDTDVKLWKRDETVGACTLFQLYTGSTDFQGLMIDAPEGFRIDRILISDDLSTCGNPTAGEIPMAAAGTVVFYGNSPDALDADVTLAFDPVEPWIPAEVVLQIMGLEVVTHCEPLDGPWTAGG